MNNTMCFPTKGNWGRSEAQLGSKDKVTTNWKTWKNTSESDPA